MPQPSSQKHIQHGGGGKEECQQSRNVMEVGHHMTTFPGSARIEDLDAVLRPSRANGIETMLTPNHIQYIRDLYADLVRICAKARERGVKIIVDAEYRYASLLSK